MVAEKEILVVLADAASATSRLYRGMVKDLAAGVSQIGFEASQRDSVKVK